MAEYQAKLDLSSAFAGLDALGGPIKESLVRRMLVEGGVHLRDEAKRWVPVKDGVLRDSLYLVFDAKGSGGNTFTYKISWNSKKAPHGHLQEFGHWMVWQTIWNAKLGRFQTLATGKGKNAKGVPRKGGPKWIAAKPFLRPAIDVGGATAVRVMIERGKKELPILIAEYVK